MNVINSLLQEELIYLCWSIFREFISALLDDLYNIANVVNYGIVADAVAVDVDLNVLKKCENTNAIMHFLDKDHVFFFEIYTLITRTYYTYLFRMKTDAGYTYTLQAYFI